MKDRIDPLIAERAPWLHRRSLWSALLRRPIERLLAYDKTVDLADALKHHGGKAICDISAAKLAKKVTVTGTRHIPESGAALVVCNHPTGIADGLVIHSILAPTRPDIFYYANRDILRVMPQMDELIVPVEWREDKRSASSARETMAITRDWISKGRLGVIFPSGRLAKRRGLTLHERPWMTSAARLAHKLNLPVIPVHLRSRNSAMFYLFDAIHPTLRDITLFHETLNKDLQPYEVTIGAAIPPSDIPADVEAGTRLLREATLGRAEPTRLPQPRPSRKPASASS